MSKQIDLSAIKRRLDIVYGDCSSGDYALSAADVPALLDHIDALTARCEAGEAEVARLRAAFAQYDSSMTFPGRVSSSIYVVTSSPTPTADESEGVK